MLPRVTLTLPCLMTRLTRARNGVEAPDFTTSAYAVRSDEAANAELSTGDTDDDFVFQDEWSNRHRVSGRRIGHLRVPERPSCFGVECDKVRIQRREEKRVAENREAAVDGSAARLHVRRCVVTIN